VPSTEKHILESSAALSGSIITSVKNASTTSCSSSRAGPHGSECTRCRCPRRDSACRHWTAAFGSAPSPTTARLAVTGVAGNRA
jgi:hypothetical protein